MHVNVKLLFYITSSLHFLPNKYTVIIGCSSAGASFVLRTSNLSVTRWTPVAFSPCRDFRGPAATAACEMPCQSMDDVHVVTHIPNKKSSAGAVKKRGSGRRRPTVTLSLQSSSGHNALSPCYNIPGGFIRPLCTIHTRGGGGGKGVPTMPL